MPISPDTYRPVPDRLVAEDPDVQRAQAHLDGLLEQAERLAQHTREARHALVEAQVAARHRHLEAAKGTAPVPTDEERAAVARRFPSPL